MKAKFFFIFLITLTLGEVSIGQSYQFATYNIKFDDLNDSENLWKDRSSHLINLMQFHKMDLIGTQEGMKNQLDEISSTLKYPYIGQSREEDGIKGEFSAIFYNPKKFTLIESNTFWLSPTPDKASKGWDAALNRICTYGKFEDKDGQQFHVFNIHYDHVGQKAREESSKLVLDKIKSINVENTPVILMGDFNVEKDNKAYEIIVKSDFNDSKNLSQSTPFGAIGTFNGFNWEKKPERIIDYIFVNQGIEVIRYGILTDNYGLKYPSDHFPVMIEVSFSANQ
ncbi:endonuclease/exonuclease/phosphatase family protein [Belliella aquatica]|uniref:Endonuclease n=1 Tax=Belliella aquatica TaxID=1323734 RepID=A0ABQ1N4Y9_9BACT|nr:endonuclease/exonuclease/phosphatase family protein [Belliella aquatica]MCH7407525.1 endonuclease/exonuclease/phosphatase family protein [Belliella aquatica]GGC54285.1 endonuclease [Belliella aquatica]